MLQCQHHVQKCCHSFEQSHRGKKYPRVRIDAIAPFGRILGSIILPARHDDVVFHKLDLSTMYLFIIRCVYRSSPCASAKSRWHICPCRIQTLQDEVLTATLSILTWRVTNIRSPLPQPWEIYCRLMFTF
jgi:hypothetical protein